jgi:hypothetical protein
MDPENISTKRYWYDPYEDYESRSKRRLQDDLGVSKAAAETILQLRSQVIALQSQIRQLETELATQYASQHMRLSRYREVYFEATWIEVKFKEGYQPSDLPLQYAHR